MKKIITMFLFLIFSFLNAQAYLSPVYTTSATSVITTPGGGTDNCFPKWQADGSYVLETSSMCLSDSGELTGLNALRGVTTIETASAFVTSLTPGRIVYTGTNGELLDSADWLFNTTGNIVTLTNGQLNVDDMTLDSNTLSTNAGNLNLTAFSELIDFQSNQTTSSRTITPINPGAPTGVIEHTRVVNVNPLANAPDLSETILSISGNYGGGNNLGGINVLFPNGNTTGAGTLSYVNYVYAGGTLGDGTNGGTTSSATMYGGNMGASDGHTVPQMKGIDINLYDQQTSVVTSVTGANINLNMNGPSNDITLSNFGFSGGVSAELTTFAGSNLNATFQAPVANTIAGFSFNPNITNTGSASAINGFYTNPSVNGLVDSMYGMFIGGNGTSTVTNYAGVDVSPTFTLPSQYLTGYRVSFSSDATNDIKGTDVQLSGDAGNITGQNVNLAGTATSEAIGISINNNAVSTGASGRNVSIGANGQSASINSGANLINNGNFDALNQVVALGTVQSGTPVSTDFFGLSSPLVLTANDDVTPGALGVGVSAVGYVSQAIVAAGKNVSDMAMATAATIDGGSGAGSSITDWAGYRSLGILNTGGNLAVTNAYHFKAEAGTVGTNVWGVWVDDATANNYFSKSISIGNPTTTNSDVALEIASKKQFKLGVMTSAEMTGLTPVKGSIVYNDDSDFPNFYNGSNWLQFGSGGGGSTSPLTTKGDLYTYDTADARLPGGPSGYVLTFDSVEATGLKWAAPGTVSPLTTKGDIYTFSTTNDRLPGGTATGNILTYDSAEATGLKWVAPAGTGLTSLNGETASTQTFATAENGSDFNIVSGAGVHTFNLPSASATVRGAVTTGAQAFGGAKTFASVIDSSLTDGRITFAGTSGDLSDDADLTFNTTGNVVTLANGQLNVDNLRLDGATLSAIATNENVTIQSDGTGDVYYKKGSDTAKSVGSRNPELPELLKYPSFEEGVAEGTCTNCTSTHSTTTGSMFGTKHLDMVFGASSTGDYTVDKTTGFDNAVPAIASCYIKTTRAGVRLYGRNGGADTSNYIDVSDAGTWTKYEVPFSCGTTSCGYKVNASTSTTTTISVNECHVTIGQKTLNVGAISGWKDYGSASSFTGFGTPTVTKLQWRQVGENIEIQTKFTAGTTTATVAKIALPDGYTIDSSKIGTNIWLDRGFLLRPGETNVNYTVIGTGGDTFARFGNTTSSPFTEQDGNSVANTAEQVQFSFSVPVTELRSQVTLSGMLGPSQIKFYNQSGCDASTSSGSFTDFVDTDCAYSTAAKIGTTVTPTTTGALALKVPTVKAGKYRAAVGGRFGSTGNTYCSYRLYDGTNVIGSTFTETNAGDQNYASGISETVEYTSDQTNLELKFQARRTAGAGNCVAYAADGDGSITISLTPISEFGAGGRPQVCYFKDFKSSGTSGGTFNSGSWETRTLNTVNETGSTTSSTCPFATLSGNVITANAGTYEINGHALGHNVDKHKARFRNTTDGSTVIVGSTARADSASGSTESFLHGKTTITSSKNFELQHQCETSKASTGFGLAAGLGESELYSEIIMTRYE